MSQKTIVLIEDNSDCRYLIENFLNQQSYKVIPFANGRQAQNYLLNSNNDLAAVDLLISDISLPDSNGLDVVESVRQKRTGVPVMIITGSNDPAQIVRAFKSGVQEVVLKPLNLSDVHAKIQQMVAAEWINPQKDIPGEDGLNPSLIIGHDPAMKRVWDLITKTGGTNANILITGESGTGKEVVAKVVHELSPRSQGPFVAVNCGAIPEGLVEAELFGHKKGSFTGANEERVGLFEFAQGGTIFLDEIGDMNLNSQIKLLRVLQDQMIRPVGGASLKKINVRVIAATNQDLKAAVRAGKFRPDLYYRLNVIPIALPPLRQRMHDIPQLTSYFIRRFNRTHLTRVQGVTHGAQQWLGSQHWPGNIRELENVLERAILLKKDGLLRTEDLMIEEFSSSVKRSSYPTLRQLECEYVGYILARSAGIKERAAEVLGIDRKTLSSKIEMLESFSDKDQIDFERALSH